MRIELDEAIARITSVEVIERCETVALAEANGRTLGAPIRARIDIPQRSLSAVDGFAASDMDNVASPTTLLVAGSSFPGSSTPNDLLPGTVVRIATGAPAPRNATRIIMREDCADHGNCVTVAQPASDARHLRHKGEECRVGDPLLPKGTLIGPRHVVAIAAADIPRVVVIQPPRVAIFGIGDELCAAGNARCDARRTPDSLSPGLAALVDAWGGIATCHTPIPDDRRCIRDAVSSAARSYDAVLLVGAASIGERDHAFAAAQDASAKVEFRGIRMKPGKPAWLSRIGAVPILGLPGNPTAAMVVARLLAAPMLCALLGRDWRYAAIWRPRHIDQPTTALAGVELIARGKFLDDGGILILDSQKASAQRSLPDADVLIRWKPMRHASPNALVLRF